MIGDLQSVSQMNEENNKKLHEEIIFSLPIDVRQLSAAGKTS
jgi:hypothetical protein